MCVAVPLVPGEIFAPRCGPGHHVGEADLVLSGQYCVGRVVEQLICESRQEQALPCKGSHTSSLLTPRISKCTGGHISKMSNCCSALLLSSL